MDKKSARPPKSGPEAQYTAPAKKVSPEAPRTAPAKKASQWQHTPKPSSVSRQEGYDEATQLHTPEKNDGRVSAFTKKWGRKLFADPVMDAISQDKAYDEGSYQARKEILGYKCGGSVKKAAGGSVRGAGCATRGTKFRGVK